MTTTTTFTFEDLKSSVTKNFKDIASAGQLFYVNIDRDEIWDRYISGFSEESRQEHNCNSCKSFLRQYAGIVKISNNQVTSLWDNLDVSEEYSQSIKNLREYIHSLPVTDVFMVEQKKCGTDHNFDLKRSITWNHFFLEVPGFAISKDIGTKQGEARSSKEVLKRSLDELSIDATETILELIAQNSLYRGNEFEGPLRKFLILQQQYRKLPANSKEQHYFCWQIAESAGMVSRIRNTAIGTLLIDLSEGLDMDAAVRKFDKVVAPSNYKRPTALVTPKMVEQAKATLAELGLLESLERRYANSTDIKVSDVIFSDRPSALTDVFDEVAKESLVNPRSFSKVEEIGIEDFLSKVVPTAKSIELLLENSHQPNMVTLLTAKNPESPSLFKWNNHFSWSYTGAVTDSIKERVKQAGGNVIGELRTSLSWFNTDDLDIHVIEPDKNRIYYGTRSTHTSGMLDVDMNVGGNLSRTPVENVIWTNKNAMLEGTYEVQVHNFHKREESGGGFIIQIECGGETFDFEFQQSPKRDEYKTIVKFDYSKADGIKFEGATKSNVISHEKWGLKTSQFHKITKLMLSPNHWGGHGTGNRHYLFILQGCRSDESPRPFFNEYLKPEMDKHRKVFEILGSKVKVEDSDDQLSGLGFSDTKRNHLIVKVTGSFARTIKVNF